MPSTALSNRGKSRVEAASTRDFPLLLNAVLGTKFKVVLGYSGNRDVQLAIEKGEIHGQCGAAWASVLATHPDWFRSGLVKVLVQEASIGNPVLDQQGVPKSVDFARTPQERQVLDLIYSQERFGRPNIMAAEVPAERNAIDYGNISVPTLVIAGKLDPLRNPGYTDGFVPKIKDVRLHVFENAGHMGNIECADEFNKLCLKFLAGVDG